MKHFTLQTYKQAFFANPLTIELTAIAPTRQFIEQLGCESELEYVAFYPDEREESTVYSCFCFEAPLSDYNLWNSWVNAARVAARLSEIDALYEKRGAYRGLLYEMTSGRLFAAEERLIRSFIDWNYTERLSTLTCQLSKHAQRT